MTTVSSAERLYGSSMWQGGEPSLPHQPHHERPTCRMAGPRTPVTGHITGGQRLYGSHVYEKEPAAKRARRVRRAPPIGVG